MEAKEQEVFGMISKMQEQRKETREILSSYYQNDYDNLITKEKFKGLKIGDRIYFNDNSNDYAELVCISSEKLVLIVVNHKDTTVEQHHHNFSEDIRVIKGELWEKISDRVLVSGDNLTIRPFQVHSLLANEYSIYTAIVNLI